MSDFNYYLIQKLYISFQMEEGQDILDNRYKIVKKLGAGAFGELWKVEKKKTGDFLAAKVEKAVKN